MDWGAGRSIFLAWFSCPKFRAASIFTVGAVGRHFRYSQPRAFPARVHDPGSCRCIPFAHANKVYAHRSGSGRTRLHPKISAAKNIYPFLFLANKIPSPK